MSADRGNVVNGLPPDCAASPWCFRAALYPHKTVLDNIVFPLKAVHLDRAERERKARWAAELLNIDRLLNRRRDSSPAVNTTRRTGATWYANPPSSARRAAVQPRRQTRASARDELAVSATCRDNDGLCDA